MQYLSIHLNLLRSFGDETIGQARSPCYGLISSTLIKERMEMYFGNLEFYCLEEYVSVISIFFYY
jgi:hypothetical protein